MAVGCSIIPAPDGFVSAMIGFLDCQATTLGSQGYMALAAPGSTAASLLTMLLTILIAMLGYRMLFGSTPTLREGVMTFVKIGIVLAFATSWPAYRTVVFDVVLRAPADLVAEIGAPVGLPGASGGLAGRMDGVDQAFRTLAIYGVGTPTRDQVDQAVGVAPPLFAGFDSFALGAARVTYLISGVGAFAFVRLVAGLLLALGPVFLGFLLFDGTRGLFIGWVRGLIGAALGGVAVAVALGVELALFEPWLVDLVARRAGGEAIPGIPAAMLAAATVFALVIVGLLGLVTRIAGGLQLPKFVALSGAPEGRLDSLRDESQSTNVHRSTVAGEGRSRAAAIVDSIAATQRREDQAMATGSGSATNITVRDGAAAIGAGGRVTTPLGSTGRRRAGTRVSASAQLRDRRA